MEKYYSNDVLVSALSLLSLFGLAYSNADGGSIMVHGLVYCDNCHVGMPTTSSKVIRGADVHMECSDHKGGEAKFSEWSKTNSEGLYEFQVGKDVNLDSYCEITPLESHKADCSNLNHDDSSQVIKLRFSNPNPADKRVVAFGNKRFASPIGFLPNEPRPECAKHHKGDHDHREGDDHQPADEHDREEASV